MRVIKRQPLTQPRPPTAREAQTQPARRKVVRPQPVAEPQRAVQRPLEMPELPELSLPSPQFKLGIIEELPEFTSETLKKLEAKPVGIAATAPKVQEASEPILDYADTEALRKAILHYEILGRPLSVRDPSERITGP